MALTTVPTPDGATCTITAAATATCGAAAVYSFRTEDGTTFHECSDHFISPVDDVVSASVFPGSTVRVTHIGVSKVGTITKVGRTRVLVRVPIGRGRTASTKVITVPIDAVVPV